MRQPESVKEPLQMTLKNVGMYTTEQVLITKGVSSLSNDEQFQRNLMIASNFIDSIDQNLRNKMT